MSTRHPRPSRESLSRRLAVAIATPVLLLVVLGLVLGRQVVSMADDAARVDHCDEVLTTTNATMRDIEEQEAAVRGYFITGDRMFLRPYDRARPVDDFARLLALTSDDPAQRARFREARDRYLRWSADLSTRLDRHDRLGSTDPDEMRAGKTLMDAIRDKMLEAITIETGTRRSVASASAAATERTKVAFVGLLGFAALALAFLSRRQLASVATTFGAALDAERAAREAIEREAWLRAGRTKLSEALQGERTTAEVGASCLGVLAEYVGAEIGAVFTKEGGRWRRCAAVSLDARDDGPETFADGEGLVGRVGMTSKLLHVRDVPRDYFRIRSGTGEAAPGEVVVFPASVDGATHAVVELGFLAAQDGRAVELCYGVGETIALAVRSAEYKQRLRELLEESQHQAEELQAQQEELRVANGELEAQTDTLRATQKRLEVQQAELEKRNEDLAEAQARASSKAREAERASQFKSQFLSNISHELRTPLNSSLILAKLLAENRTGNLSEEQTVYARTIYDAGNDLLELINGILDLSKIESGKMDVHVDPVSPSRVRDVLLRTFEPVARDKGLRFAVTLDPSAPAEMTTDLQRLEQILRNLVSNALKFTSDGEVCVDVSARDDRVVFAVRDTGVGIPTEQRSLVFDAFRQGDGTTSRKYGGTGLGLSISRELARLLGGDVTLASEVGVGSTFTLTLPRVYDGPSAAADTPSPPPLSVAPESAAPEPDAEAEYVDAGGKLVLVVEDDPNFAGVLNDVASDAGLSTLVTQTAEEGFRLAKKRLPAAIVLDMKLPDHVGLTLLDRLKRDPATRHIPVHVISAYDHAREALSMGATGYSRKPLKREQLLEILRSLERRATSRARRLLVVGDDGAQHQSIAKVLAGADVTIDTATSASAALSLLDANTYDCVVTDLSLPDRSDYDLLEAMAGGARQSVPPVIVYTGRTVNLDDEQRLRKHSRSIIIKGTASSERLLEEVTLFLHHVESELPAEQRKLLAAARAREAAFEGRTILVVEDDVRNVYALTSLLEPKGARVAIARNGKEALSVLERESRVDLVVMDVMLPEMDGLEATRAIRRNPKWKELPVVALTAKAMPDDRAKCLEAGANDYLAKPLDVEMLLSVLRVWMPKR